MPFTQQQAALLAIFKTKPIGADGYFVKGVIDFISSLVADISNTSKAYSLTRAQRLALITANVTLGSLVFETDTNHVVTWSGKAWIQLV